MKEGTAPYLEGPEGRIFLIRHGKTAWTKHRYLGWEDVPLDDVGMRQSHEIASRLEEERIDVIYSSPLTRAVETIRPLAETRGIPVIIAPNLKEMHYGQWQGLLKSERRLRIKGHHLYLPLPGGESLFDVYRRAGRFVEGLRANLAAGHHLVVVGHLWINLVIMETIHRLPFGAIVDQSDYKPTNGSIFEIRYVVDSNEKVQVLSSGFIGMGLKGIESI